MEELELKVTCEQFKQVDKFDLCKQMRLVPPFDESEVDRYFQYFEKVAQSGMA